jgi:hypothetical protein
MQANDPASPLRRDYDSTKQVRSAVMHEARGQTWDEAQAVQTLLSKGASEESVGLGTSHDVDWWFSAVDNLNRFGEQSHKWIKQQLPESGPGDEAKGPRDSKMPRVMDGRPLDAEEENMPHEISEANELSGVQDPNRHDLEKSEEKSFLMDITIFQV